MSERLRRLPFTMQTVFQDVLLLTYRVPPEQLAAQLPACIHPYVREGHSYVSIIVANMRGMRPKVMPELAGVNAYQIVYRAVIRLFGANGREYPGVFFLRTDCNDPVLTLFGNQLSEFRFHYFHTSAIAWLERGDEILLSIESSDRGGDLVVHLRNRGRAETQPSAGDFADLTDEKETLVELFHAYTHDQERKLIFDLEIERGNWNLERLDCLDSFSAFFQESPFDLTTAELASTLYIRECDYIWKPMRALSADAFRPRPGT